MRLLTDLIGKIEPPILRYGVHRSLKTPSNSYFDRCYSEPLGLGNYLPNCSVRSLRKGENQQSLFPPLGKGRVREGLWIELQKLF